MGKAHISDALQAEVRARALGRCEYCKVSEYAQVALFHCDHCVPEVRDGPTMLENLAWACPRCNASKWTAARGIDPVTNESVSLFNPRTDLWPEHFAWSEDALSVIGRTATGRATIERLKMNRPKMLEIRRLMKRLKLHPPP